MNPFFLLFIGLPALEIFLLIKIGGQLGALNTVALIFLTAIIGIYFAKLQGIQTLKSGMVNLYQNKMPVYEMMSGASIAFAALLLIIPGFFTDLIGFLLLIPFTRKIFFKLAFKNKPLTDIEKEGDTLDGEVIDNKKMTHKIIGKYIKELKFNIPNPKTFFLLAKDIANYKINIDIKSVQVKQNIIEVLTSLKLTPVKGNFDKIDTKIVFSTIVEFGNENLAKEEMEKTILVNVPSKIYPELRQIFIFLFENSGFKDIKINEKVDFEKLYKMRKVQ